MHLSHQPDTEDGLIPKRVKSFSEDLVDECTSAPLQERGTGASSLAFTPDSNRLIIGFALSAALVAVELGKEARPHLRVLRVFLADALESGRGVMTLSQRSAVQANGDKGRSMPNGHVNGVLPMEMDESESGSAVGSPETDDEKSDGEEDVVNVAVATSLTRVNMLAVSEDGQWLASCDNRGHVNVYNLDVLKVSSMLLSELLNEDLTRVPHHDSFTALFQPSSRHRSP
jgi:U3 small nucleolar RNA-associated protein 4